MKARNLGASTLVPGGDLANAGWRALYQDSNNRATNQAMANPAGSLVAPSCNRFREYIELLRRPTAVDRNGGARNVVRVGGAKPDRQAPNFRRGGESVRGLLFSQHRVDCCFARYAELFT